MSRPRILGLVAALARDEGGRRRAARELASQLGSDDLLILTFQEDHFSYLPVCGFPQTLYQSRRWKAFTHTVATNGSANEVLSYPTSGRERNAWGWAATDGTILTLFDAEPCPDQVREVLDLLPLLTATFEKERIIITSTAKAKLSEQAAQRARELAESLDSVRRQLQATLILREQDIAERERIEEQLEMSNNDLRRVNDDLNQFTFAATHDVREPLRMMSIYTQLLQKELAGSMSRTALVYIEKILNGAQRLSRLIDGLLQFTRLGGLHQLTAVPVDAQAALKEALDDLHMAITESDTKLIVGDLPIVMADLLHVRQVFQNLIGNSIKYRRPGLDPVIQITSERRGNFWCFEIRDNGIGIAPEHHDQIFLPFKRLHGSDIAGAGIGLATCKRLVERYGGRIWIESEENKGAIFNFSFPAVEGESGVSY
ncbi:MAG: ATP-binding protein [Acidobacteriota bacterium]|nr:ATP-binding protein [Acidobacteriota bacterium]